MTKQYAPTNSSHKSSIDLNQSKLFVLRIDNNLLPTMDVSFIRLGFLPVSFVLTELRSQTVPLCAIQNFLLMEKG